MRTSTLFLAAISAAAVYASAASESATLEEDAFPTPTLTPKQQLAMDTMERNMQEFNYVDGYSSLMSDYMKWQEAYMVTQTAIPTDLPAETEMDAKVMQQYAQNAIEQVAGLLEVAQKKDYMEEDNQLSFIAQMEAYVTLLSEVAEAVTAEATASATASVKETGSAKEATASATASLEKTASAKETADASTKSQADEEASVTSSAGAEATASENQQDEDSSAGRVSGVGAFAAMLVAGIVAVVAL